jgi:hypothetical protein
METEIVTDAEAPKFENEPSLPKNPAAPADADAEALGEAERNPVFAALVKPDDDVEGLVAYSLYKQNKRDWLDHFVKATGRAPNEAETRAYIIGESTERRLNTYRQLAAATLAGQQAQAADGAPRKTSSTVSALWALAVVVALAVLWLALRAGYLTLPK